MELSLKGGAKLWALDTVLAVTAVVAALVALATVVTDTAVTDTVPALRLLSCFSFC